jgi:hypothetical protein
MALVYEKSIFLALTNGSRQTAREIALAADSVLSLIFHHIGKERE